MVEYINKQKLIDILEAKADMAVPDYKPVFHSVAKIVELLPAADVAPVWHGRWVDMQEDGCAEGMWRCSACGEDFYYSDGHPSEDGARYCLNCGARMDGGTDNEM